PSRTEAPALMLILSVFLRPTSLRGPPGGNSSRMTPASWSDLGVVVAAASVGLAPLGRLVPLGLDTTPGSHASAVTNRRAALTGQRARRDRAAIRAACARRVPSPAPKVRLSRRRSHGASIWRSPAATNP